MISYSKLFNKEKMVCSYYQARVERWQCWFVVAILKSYEHMSFDRTLDKKTSTFEFFVPESTEKYFLEVMHYFIAHDIISEFRKLPNRMSLNHL